jgi:hypothetical protein
MEVNAGKPVKQAVAIAYSKARGDMDRKDASPLDIARNELNELQRRMGSGSPESQNKWRARIAELKEKIKRIGGFDLSGLERKDATSPEQIAERLRSIYEQSAIDAKQMRLAKDYPLDAGRAKPRNHRA